MDLYWTFLIKVFEGSLTVQEAEMQESVTTDILFYLGSAILFILGFIPIVYFFIKKINRPIGETAQKMKELALGNYDLQMDIEKSNEFAEIAEAFKYMTEELKKPKS